MGVCRIFPPSSTNSFDEQGLPKDDSPLRSHTHETYRLILVCQHSRFLLWFGKFSTSFGRKPNFLLSLSLRKVAVEFFRVCQATKKNKTTFYIPLKFGQGQGQWLGLKENPNELSIIGRIYHIYLPQNLISQIKILV